MNATIGLLSAAAVDDFDDFDPDFGFSLFLFVFFVELDDTFSVAVEATLRRKQEQLLMGIRQKYSCLPTEGANCIHKKGIFFT